MATIAQLQDLTGRVAVVTGGSRGIGRAIVQTLAEAGADVVIASRRLASCEQAAAEVRATTGRRAMAVEFHAGRWSDCDRLFATAIAEFGRLDVLVNNAGMSPTYAKLSDVGEDLYDKTLAVNLKGPFLVTGAGGGIGRAYSRGLAEAGAAVVLADVNVQSATAAADELSADASGSDWVTGHTLNIDGGWAVRV